MTSTPWKEALESALCRRFTGEGTPLSLFLLEEATSTMDVARERLHEAATAAKQGGDGILRSDLPLPFSHGVVAFAREQTQGRGRKERVWSSERDSGVYLTVGLAFAAERGRPLTGLPLAVGFSLCEELRRCVHSERIVVKWPNDLLVAPLTGEGERYGKLAGILIESSSTGVFIGVGVNVFQREELHGEQRAGAEQNGEERPRAALSLLASVELPCVATSILAAVLQGVERFFSEGLTKVHHLWPTHALHAGGGRVRLEDGVTGEVVGLSSEGGLLVQTPAETGGAVKTVFAGDIFYFL